MKRALLLATLLVLAFPNPATGHSAFLGWNDCYGEPGFVDKLCLDCTGASGTVSLFVAYQLDSAVTAAQRLEAVIEMYFEYQGCNDGYLAPGDARPDGKCTTYSATLCRPTGGGCGLSSFYEVSYYTRLIVVLQRPSQDAVNLEAGRHFAFGAEMDMSNATEAGGTCAGCASVVRLRLNSLAIWRESEDIEIIFGAWSPGPPPTYPEAWANSPGCAVSARNRTWGQLKALYR